MQKPPLARAWPVGGGLAAITGAFVAGLGFGRSHLRATIGRSMHTITYAFLVPILFVGIGIKTNVRPPAAPDLLLALALVIVAVASASIAPSVGFAKVHVAMGVSLFIVASVAGLGCFETLSVMALGVGLAQDDNAIAPTRAKPKPSTLIFISSSVSDVNPRLLDVQRTGLTFNDVSARSRRVI
jgi:Kef-type K+ transport system membrane component KefB